MCDTGRDLLDGRGYRDVVPRLVALGYSQVPGVDVFNTFAPVVKSVTVRLLLALAFIINMHVHQRYISNAFSYARIEGDVYMQPTPDYH